MPRVNRTTAGRIVALFSLVVAGALIITALITPRPATAEDSGVADSPVYETTDGTTGASVEVSASTDEDGDQCLDVEVFQMAVDAPSGSFGGCGFAGAVDTITSTDACFVINRQTSPPLCPVSAPTLQLASVAGSTATEDSPTAPRIAGALVALICSCQVTLHFSDGSEASAVTLPASVAQRVGVPFLQFGYRAVAPGVNVISIDVVSTDLGIVETRTFHLRTPPEGPTSLPPA